MKYQFLPLDIDSHTPITEVLKLNWRLIAIQRKMISIWGCLAMVRENGVIYFYLLSEKTMKPFVTVLYAIFLFQRSRIISFFLLYMWEDKFH